MAMHLIAFYVSYSLHCTLCIVFYTSYYTMRVIFLYVFFFANIAKLLNVYISKVKINLKNPEVMEDDALEDEITRKLCFTGNHLKRKKQAQLSLSLALLNQPCFLFFFNYFLKLFSFLCQSCSSWHNLEGGRHKAFSKIKIFIPLTFKVMVSFVGSASTFCGWVLRFITCGAVFLP